ncbi:MAG: phytoene desaturase family protein [Flavobacteriales bacterium]
MKSTVTIIGSGFASLSAACYLAKAGYEVHVYEQNARLGGRARQFEFGGYRFDMGPTWYWMPDVFERFFADFGKKPSDYYELERLSPAYKVYFGKDDHFTIPGTLEEIVTLFESKEVGAGNALQRFITKAGSNYDVAIKNLVYKPGKNITELITMDTITEVQQFFSAITSTIRKNFKDFRLRQILEFPVLFLGAKPADTPQFYSFMNYADFALGTWHPKGGMYSVVKGMVALAKELGVAFETNAAVQSINVSENGVATSITVNNDVIPVDILISGADYKHSEDLLPEQFRAYSANYWETRTMAPSALLFYVGFNQPIQNVEHHTLFFDTSFDGHAEEIYDAPSWPKEPLFYASFPSKSDNSMAPIGMENGIFLIPLAPDLEDTEEMRDKYFEMIMERMEILIGQNVREHVLFQRSYCINDFKKDYNSFKGNAYGMANTLMQTAFLRPKIKSKKVKNMFFTGQLTVPGPGVPPSLISGKIVSESVINENSKSHDKRIQRAVVPV